MKNMSDEAMERAVKAGAAAIGQDVYTERVSAERDMWIQRYAREAVTAAAPILLAAKNEEIARLQDHIDSMPFTACQACGCASGDEADSKDCACWCHSPDEGYKVWQERLAEAEARAERLEAALERILHNFEAVLARRPVRDASETIAEANAAASAPERG